MILSQQLDLIGSWAELSQANQLIRHCLSLTKQ